MELYRQIIQDDFSTRQERNPKYSLRAYASYLDISPATLSGILNNKRRLPPKSAKQVAIKLELSPIRSQAFLKSVELTKVSLKGLSELKNNSINEKVLDEQKDYNIIAYWEYFAFLNLIETENFQDSNNWVAERLCLSKERVLKVKDELLDRKYISYQDGILKRSKNNLTTSKDVFSKALRHSHKENLEIAKEKIESIPVNERYFSSSTIAVDMDKIDEAKELVREFRDKLSTLLSSGHKTEVYNLNLQLFPITNLTNTNGEKNENINA